MIGIINQSKSVYINFPLDSEKPAWNMCPGLSLSTYDPPYDPIWPLIGVV